MITFSTNTDNFTFPFLIWVPFIYFSYLIVLDRTFSTILHRTDKSGIFVFFLVLEKKLLALYR